MLALEGMSPVWAALIAGIFTWGVTALGAGMVFFFKTINKKILNVMLGFAAAGIFTWGVTALGAGMVFFFKTINKKILNVMLGFAAGVMIAASFWSLLAPAIEMSEGGSLPNGSLPNWFPALVGFLGGSGFLWVLDKVMPHIHPGTGHEEGVHTSWHRSVLLVLAITFHNIPEGFAVGVAFGGLASGNASMTLAGAISLAVGIGLQNFPEGAAVSIPLRREGISRMRSFMYGQFSGMVEPIAAVCRKNRKGELIQWKWNVIQQQAG